MHVGLPPAASSMISVQGSARGGFRRPQQGHAAAGSLTRVQSSSHGQWRPHAGGDDLARAVAASRVGRGLPPSTASGRGRPLPTLAGVGFAAGGFQWPLPPPASLGWGCLGCWQPPLAKAVPLVLWHLGLAYLNAYYIFLHTTTYDNPKKYTRESISPRRAKEVKIESSMMSALNAGGVPDSENAKDFLDSIEEQFQSSSKALATTLIIKMGFSFARKLNKGEHNVLVGNGNKVPVEAVGTLSLVLESERNILVGNGNKVPVEAIGTLSLALESGFKLNLFDTVYVLSITRNLISVS
ncbi:hypothetical protein ZIOFF_033716 [Zingiber officinale]|uniref:Retrovirus-related Pol polyprotein from transposon TNT 1-94-like beta-barrel domain-containing protein n=1 Tax=Zingiber officinale TaxID=94328 RepID=A0A8J5LCP2_ZINOF|nr:hypothetical protein ZIOFF_033716 [Zingiber officinale]